MSDPVRDPLTTIRDMVGYFDQRDIAVQILDACDAIEREREQDAQRRE